MNKHLQARYELHRMEFSNYFSQMIHDVEHVGLNEQEKKIFDSNCQFIKKMLAEKTYQIAISGRYQTGKSTFLNALLQTPNLLKSGLGNQTTAALTYLEYGERFDIQIQSDKGETVAFFENPHVFCQKIAPLVPYKELMEYQGLKERNEKIVSKLLHNLTTIKYQGNQRNIIKKIIVRYPSRFLKDGLVLVDTPGVGVENPDHQKATEIAFTEADACLLIFQTQQSVPKDFFDFLKNHQANLKKIFLVLTKADEAIETDEIDDDIHALEEVVKLLCKKLKNDLGISKSIKIYPLACQKILQKIQGKTPLNIAKYEELQSNFENDLDEFVHLERECIILNRAIKIVLDTCQVISRKIQTSMASQKQSFSPNNASSQQLISLQQWQRHFADHQYLFADLQQSVQQDLDCLQKKHE